MTTKYTETVVMDKAAQKLLDFAITAGKPGPNGGGMGINLGWAAQGCEIARGDIGPTFDSGIILGSHALGDHHLHDLDIHDSWVPSPGPSQGVHGVYDTAVRTLTERVRAWDHPHGSCFSPRWPNTYLDCRTGPSQDGYGVFDYSDGKGGTLLIRGEVSQGLTEFWIYFGGSRSHPGDDAYLGPVSFGLCADHCTLDLRKCGDHGLNLQEVIAESWLTNSIIITDKPTSGWLIQPKGALHLDGTVVLTSAQAAQWLNADLSPKVAAGSPLIGKAVASPARAAAYGAYGTDVGALQSAVTPPPPPPPPFQPDVPGAILHITKTLDWFHSTQKTGGRGYSVAQTKSTEAYKALLALGGVWPLT